MRKNEIDVIFISRWHGVVAGVSERHKVKHIGKSGKLCVFVEQVVDYVFEVKRTVGKRAHKLDHNRSRKIGINPAAFLLSFQWNDMMCGGNNLAFWVKLHNSVFYPNIYFQVVAVRGIGFFFNFRKFLENFCIIIEFFKAENFFNKFLDKKIFVFWRYGDRIYKFFERTVRSIPLSAETRLIESRFSFKIADSVFAKSDILFSLL